jgi:hypothetical protein
VLEAAAEAAAKSVSEVILGDQGELLGEKICRAVRERRRNRMAFTAVSGV